MKAKWGSHRLGVPGFKRRVQVRVVEWYGSHYVRSRTLILHGMLFERVWGMLWTLLSRRLKRTRGPKR